VESEAEEAEAGGPAGTSPLHQAPGSPQPLEPLETPRARHPGHVKSASISAGSGGGQAQGGREAPASAGAADRCGAGCC
jgi:hypothetical protein